MASLPLVLRVFQIKKGYKFPHNPYMSHIFLIAIGTGPTALPA